MVDASPLPAPPPPPVPPHGPYPCWWLQMPGASLAALAPSGVFSAPLVAPSSDHPCNITNIDMFQGAVPPAYRLPPPPPPRPAHTRPVWAWAAQA